MMTRRDFMVSGITATGVGIVVPPVFAQSVFAATIEDIHNDHVLVILQLGGGNDGLNTVIPYTDPAYPQARPTIGIADDKVLPLNAEVGLNPVMPGMKKLFDAGEVALVQGVGYPNPVYSHFEGLYIWEHADPTMEQTDGWLGKLLASQLKEWSLSSVLIVVEASDEKLSLAARNLPHVEVIGVSSLNPLSLAAYEKVLMTVGAVKMIEGRLP